MPEFTLSLSRAIELTNGDIGLNEYPIFEEEHRPILNQKIIDHFWNQEIGQETISMFQHALRRRMNEIMPRYNQLYKTQLLKFDPLLTMGLITTGETEVSQEAESISNGKETGTSSGSQTSGTDSKSRAVASTTPQHALEQDKDYADSSQDTISGATTQGESAAATENESESAATSTGTTKGNTSQEISGFNGSRSQLLMEFRETILNIDVDIINELKDLFMLVWSNGDSSQIERRGYGFPYHRSLYRY